MDVLWLLAVMLLTFSVECGGRAAGGTPPWYLK
jgi:hypothetical protein